MKVHAECYGHLFPPVASLASNQDVAGAVFRYRVEQTGTVTTVRSTAVDSTAWDKCTACADFDTCYRLSVGTLLMDIAVRE